VRRGKGNREDEQVEAEEKVHDYYDFIGFTANIVELFKLFMKARTVTILHRCNRLGPKNPTPRGIWI
jgi:hypothetical protein